MQLEKVSLSFFLVEWLFDEASISRVLVGGLGYLGLEDSVIPSPQHLTPEPPP